MELDVVCVLAGLHATGTAQASFTPHSIHLFEDLKTVSKGKVCRAPNCVDLKSH